MKSTNYRTNQLQNSVCSPTMSSQMIPIRPKCNPSHERSSEKLNSAARYRTKPIAAHGQSPDPCTLGGCLQHLYTISTRKNLPLGRGRHAIRCIGTRITSRRSWTVHSLSKASYAGSAASSSTAIEYKRTSVVSWSGWSISS